MDGHEYLDFLQRSTSMRGGFDGPSNNIEDLVVRIETSAAASWRELEILRPTDEPTRDHWQSSVADSVAKIRGTERVAGNDVTTQFIFHQSLERISRVAQKGKMWSGALPVLGTLPIVQPNACAMRVPGGNHTIVAFSMGLPIFLNRTSKILLDLFSLVTPTEWIDVHKADAQDAFGELLTRRLRKSPRLARYFAEVILCFIRGTLALLPRHRTDFLHDVGRSQLLRGIENFIVAHELGHVMLGHSGSVVPTTTHDIGGQNVAVLQRSHADEYVADIMGFLLSLTAVVEEPAVPYEELSESATQGMQALETAGPTFFLLVAEVLEEATGMLPLQPPRLDTHPPFVERRKCANEWYASVTGNVSNSYASDMETGIITLWKASRSIVEKAIIQSDRPAELAKPHMRRKKRRRKR